MDIKPLLICDSDDSLHEFGIHLYSFHNKEYGTNYTENDMKDYNLCNAWGCDRKEVQSRLARYYESDEHWNAPPVEGSVEVLELLSEYYRFGVVTAKPDYLEKRQVAYYKKWFADLIELVVFTNHHDEQKMRTKLEVCLELKAVKVVEDHIDYANQIANGGIPVYLLRKPWNAGDTHPLVTRVEDWYEIYEYEKKLFVAR